ncbi:MAG TPA: hypothetical protein VFN72_03320 [Solirubrobacterales bacterium]|nr:hypothetical protein [Solirubrobacterales bacterium]
MEAGVLAEAAAMPWRRRASDRSLTREGRVWTLWSAGVLITFGLPAALLIWIEPLAAPVSAIFLGHGLAVLHLQARRGARGVKPIGAEASDGPERRALGLLGDLLGHDSRELLTETGLALQRGALGAWLVGQEGAILVRNGGHRVHCFCVRVGEPGDLPAGDRVAHLLLALREDEEGFATVANRNFSGARWRLRRQLPARARPALSRARSAAAA